jgi:hypothetical protein
MKALRVLTVSFFFFPLSLRSAEHPEMQNHKLYDIVHRPKEEEEEEEQENKKTMALKMQGRRGVSQFHHHSKGKRNKKVQPDPIACSTSSQKRAIRARFHSRARIDSDSVPYLVFVFGNLQRSFRLSQDRDL